MPRGFGLVTSALLVGVAIAACRPNSDVGYVEIKTVPVAPLTQVALYIDSAKLGPIKRGNAILRQQVGKRILQAGFAGALAPLCAIEVQKNRITTVTVSVLDRPPRCRCRFGGADATAGAERACVS